MEIGDCITHVDGIPVSELKSFLVIRGPVNSKVALRIRRGIPGSRELAEKLVELKQDSTSEANENDLGLLSVSSGEANIIERIIIFERKLASRPPPKCQDSKKEN